MIDYENGMTNLGDFNKIKGVFYKASLGQNITVGFLGGSITQGARASTPEKCYAYLVYEWWKNKFPKIEVTYLNAGIGGTTSHFGVARVEEDLLKYKPDFITVEFSVNDEANDFFEETYEGLIRKILYGKNNTAPLIIHNVFYDTGRSSQEQHESVGKHYDIPCVSMKTSVYPHVEAGEINARDITPDDLHPNDDGHRLLANLVIYMLEKIYDDFLHNGVHTNQDASLAKEPCTLNGYEACKRFNNNNCNPILTGYEIDTRKQEYLADIFKNGWISQKKGDCIIFELEGSSIAIQYRKSVKHPACIAKVIVDGKDEEAVVLDGNFEEDWGDCLYLQPIVHHGEKRKHIIRIETISGQENLDVPFYLNSIIIA